MEPQRTNGLSSVPLEDLYYFQVLISQSLVTLRLTLTVIILYHTLNRLWIETFGSYFGEIGHKYKYLLLLLTSRKLTAYRPLQMKKMLKIKWTCYINILLFILFRRSPISFYSNVSLMAADKHSFVNKWDVITE